MFLEPLSKCSSCLSYIFLVTFQPVTFQPVAIRSATMTTTSASHNIKVAIPSATNKTNQNAVTHMAVPIGIIG